MSASAPLRVLQVMRRPFPTGNHSIEGLFETVRAHLPPDVAVEVGMAPRVSQGLRNRLANLSWMRRTRLPITHITGDVTYLAAALPREGTIVTIHDTGWANRSRPGQAAFYYLWVTMPVRRAERVTVISSHVRDRVLEISGCDPAKVVVIPNCVHPDFVPPVVRASRATPEVLLVGSSANKNVERVAAALGGIDCTVHLVGAPSVAQVAALDRHGIRYRVSTNVSRAELVAAYQHADLVAFASTFEGFGLVILEGQAVGTPVVTSDLSPMREVAGGAACLVDPYDVASIRAGIERTLGDPAYRERLRAAGFANVAGYLATPIAERYADLYHAVAGERPPVRAPRAGQLAAAGR